MGFNSAFKGLNAKLNLICHLLALLGAHHILHVSRIRVNALQGTWHQISLSHLIEVFRENPARKLINYIQSDWNNLILCILSTI